MFLLRVLLLAAVSVACNSRRGSGDDPPASNATLLPAPTPPLAPAAPPQPGVGGADVATLQQRVAVLEQQVAALQQGQASTRQELATTQAQLRQTQAQVAGMQSQARGARRRMQDMMQGQQGQ